MHHKELIKNYLDFFKSKGHAIIDSAPLIPEHDPTVLFTTAGMHPLVPFLMGQKHPLGKKIVNFQKCIRTGDIDSVGNTTHHTFFIMLGNWSFGDYFKREAIEYSFEYLTKVLGLSLDRLGFTCFKGDKDAAKDVESFDKWVSLGVNEDKILFLDRKDNWWGPAGESGPCGPCTEMFYWVGDDVPLRFDVLDKRWVEIWNDVFIEYDKLKNGSFKLLKQNGD